LLASEPLRRSLGENGHRFVLENYAWETIAKKFIVAFKKILSKGGENGKK
jgi:glycosyltransferase involved in cell wall biosynthesis